MHHSNTNDLKLIGPCRTQYEMQFGDLEALLPPEHLARSIWEFVEAMDTRPCFSYVNTFKYCAGRPMTSPKILLALWLYTILDGNCSARKLEELCKNHNAYRWIVGRAPINRTMLAAFRSKDTLKFEDLLTNCLAVMVKAGLIEDKDFAQDGTKIKANAGNNSFRSETSLKTLKEKMMVYIQQLKDAENEYDKRAINKKTAIAEERLRRIDEALDVLEKEREIKKENAKKNRVSPPSDDDLNGMRASTTDPIVRRMKMGDGGYRLAYNVQLATGLDSRVIYGVDVVTTLDPGTSPRMMAKVHSRLAKLNMLPPKNWVCDAAYSGSDDINTVAKLFPNCRYYAPPQVNKGIDPKKYRKTDSEAIKNWRDMIGTDETKEIYKKRCSTAEFSNAQLKNFGLSEFLVRNIEKVKGMAILHAIAQNVSRFFNLKTQNVDLISY